MDEGETNSIHGSCSGLSKFEVKVVDNSADSNTSLEEEDKCIEELNLGKYRTLKSSIEEPLELELKLFPDYLEYGFLAEGSKLPIIIASDLIMEQKGKLLNILKKHNKVIAWKILDIKEISPSFCSHKNLMENNHRPMTIPQRGLDPNMKEVVRNEVIKHLDTGIIYPIFDSKWVSPVQVVLKKGR